MSKLKTHLKQHKTFYIGISTGIALAGITVLIMKGRLALQSPPEPSFADSGFFFSGNRAGRDINVTANIHNGTRGHPGFLTSFLETGELFHTQGEAASAYGVNPKVMSEHLRGFHDTANGYHFKRVNFVD